MKIAIGCDHRGYEGKRKLIPLLKKLGHHVHDFGCENVTPCDYPDFAGAVAQAVASGDYEIGVLLDGSGIGMSVTANKVFGVRAGLVHDEVTARLARESNHCNVLCIGTDLLSEEQLRTIVEIFLSTPFAPGRHLRRVTKISELESHCAAARQARATAVHTPATPHAPAHKPAATAAR